MAKEKDSRKTLELPCSEAQQRGEGGGDRERKKQGQAKSVKKNSLAFLLPPSISTMGEKKHQRGKSSKSTWDNKHRNHFRQPVCL
jgi:hypothetical protein